VGLFRFLLALSVVLWHTETEYMLLNGGIAVIAFYCISGFYMTLVLNNKYLISPNGIKLFYLNRLLRLYPVYLVWLFFVAAWLLMINQENILTGPANLPLHTRILLIFSNLSFIGIDFWKGIAKHQQLHGASSIITFLQSLFGSNAFTGEYIIIGPAWTLGVELLFYAVAPFIVVSPRRTMLFFALSLIVRIILSFFPVALPCDPWGYRFLPSVLVFFLMGSFSYRLYVRVQSVKWGKSVGYACITTFVLILVVSSYLYKILFDVNYKSNYDHPILWVFYICFAMTLPFVFLATKNIKLDYMLGELSYPMYIIHTSVIKAIKGWGYNKNLNYSFFIIAMTIIISIMMVAFIERPMDKFRHTLLENSQTGVASTAQAWAVLVLMLISPYLLLNSFVK
jgi:peptidoglycan/LPS O-acetylase OafA/YrhL